jgi:hypothetical protein
MVASGADLDRLQEVSTALTKIHTVCADGQGAAECARHVSASLRAAARPLHSR